MSRISSLFDENQASASVGKAHVCDAVSPCEAGHTWQTGLLPAPHRNSSELSFQIPPARLLRQENPSEDRRISGADLPGWSGNHFSRTSYRSDYAESRPASETAVYFCRRAGSNGSLGFRRAGSDFRRLGGSYPSADKSYRRRFSVALGGGRAGPGYQPDGTGSLVK